MDDNKGCLAWLIVIPLAIVGAIALIGKGSFWSFLGKIFFWGIGIVVLGLVAIVGLVLFLVFRGSRGKKKGGNPSVPASGTSTSARKGQAAPQTVEAPSPADNTNPEQRAILDKGEESLDKLRQMAAQVKNAQIQTAAAHVCDQAEKILQTLREQPDLIPTVRQFLNHYLPTTGEILMKYQRMEQGRVVDSEMTDKVF